MRLVLALAAVLALASTAVQAAPFFSYCSTVGASYNNNGTVASSDGWTYWSDNANVNPLWACKYAQAKLVYETGHEAIRMESGWFDSNANNKVQIDCLDGYKEIVTGLAGAAFQNGANRAATLGKTCLLRIVP
jgi:hypothetical protein